MYNAKIIETPTTIEVWCYDTARYGDMYDKYINQLVKERKDALKGKLESLDDNSRRNYDELTAEEKIESLKKKEQYYKNKRHDIKRLVDCNIDCSSSFLTLTFAENIKEVDFANKEFKKFIQRFKRWLAKTGNSPNLQYLATWERQKRGAIHYHVILFNVPYIPQNELLRIWGNGFVWINHINNDGMMTEDGKKVPLSNVGLYVSKYFAKEIDLKEHKKKAFFSSRNLKKPKQKMIYVEDINNYNPIETFGKVSSQSEYTIPVFELKEKHDGNAYHEKTDDVRVKYYAFRKDEM